MDFPMNFIMHTIYTRVNTIYGNENQWDPYWVLKIPQVKAEDEALGSGPGCLRNKRLFIIRRWTADATRAAAPRGG